jgi:capsular polysaccharide export protein
LHEILPLMSGAVCVNSTAGLAAVEFGKPTVVLGRALYDMPGLTHQDGIDTFWRSPQAPDPRLYEAFRQVMMATTQVNGAYATRRGRALAVPEAGARLLHDDRNEAFNPSV